MRVSETSGLRVPHHHFIGAAVGSGAGFPGCCKAPFFLQEHTDVLFQEIISHRGERGGYDSFKAFFSEVSKAVYHVLEKGFPIVIGGDHSCAIGTWSGVSTFYHDRGQDVGLIWVDAHMDSHTPETTPSGNIHGMPLAALLGFGDQRFTTIGGTQEKIKPENVILIGVRSYEEEEAELLSRLGVQIHFMEEARQKGIEPLMTEAFQQLSARVPVGLSIDMDGLDPQFAPGVGTPVADGLSLDALLASLAQLDLAKCCALELVEYNPDLDPLRLTQQTLLDILSCFTKRSFKMKP